ncbi:MAG TPA: hypothetical protein VFI02_14025 [Armatimonadota bacterium]|nr:hypothetical protein [Armatimonadota bacterium]
MPYPYETAYPENKARPPQEQPDLVQQFLLSALKAGGQEAPAVPTPGMSPLTAFGVGSGINLAGDLISHISQGGKRAGDKGRAIRDRGRLEKLYDEDVFDPLAIDAASRNAIYDDVRALGGKIDQDIGLDTGTGRGVLYEKMITTRRKALVDMMLNAALAKSQRKTDIASTLFQNSQATLRG